MLIYRFAQVPSSAGRTPRRSKGFHMLLRYQFDGDDFCHGAKLLDVARATAPRTQNFPTMSRDRIFATVPRTKKVQRLQSLPPGNLTHHLRHRNPKQVFGQSKNRRDQD